MAVYQLEEYYPNETDRNQIIAECIAEISVSEEYDNELFPLKDVVKELEEVYGIAWPDWGNWL